MVRAELRKWEKTITVAMSRYLAYKADFLLMLVAPSFVFLAVNYSVWYSIYKSQDTGSIAGFSKEQMLHYQCWSFIASLLIRSHRTWNLSEHIRFGRITSFLLYPFDAWKFYAGEFIAFQILQFVTTLLSIGLLRVCHLLPPLDLATCFVGICFALLVSVMWFVCEFTMGLAGFWLEEVWIFRVVLGFFAVFFSGAFIPLELFPESLQTIISWTPFPFITSIPVHIFLGTEPVAIWSAVLTLCAWTLGLAVVGAVVWRRGLKLYTAAGI